MPGIRTRFRSLTADLPPSYWFLWLGTVINRLGGFVIPFLTLYLTSERGISVAQAGLVVSPLFSAFGPEPIATRMNLGEARALVTTTTLYRRKVEPVRARIPSLAQVLLIPDGDDALPPDTHDFDALLRGASEAFATVATRPDDAALLHFTSGTTGKPKQQGPRRGRHR